MRLDPDGSSLAFSGNSSNIVFEEGVPSFSDGSARAILLTGTHLLRDGSLSIAHLPFCQPFRRVPGPAYTCRLCGGSARGEVASGNCGLLSLRRPTGAPAQRQALYLPRESSADTIPFFCSRGIVRDADLGGAPRRTPLTLDLFPDGSSDHKEESLAFYLESQDRHSMKRKHAVNEAEARQAVLPVTR